MATVASSNKKPLNPNPFAWTDDDRTRWRAENIIDDADLVRFDTLHNMQVRSCRVFAPKPLFATYSAESKAFEWMTFGECEFVCFMYSFVSLRLFLCVSSEYVVESETLMNLPKSHLLIFMAFAFVVVVAGVLFSQ